MSKFEPDYHSEKALGLIEALVASVESTQIPDDLGDPGHELKSYMEDILHHLNKLCVIMNHDEEGEEDEE